MGLEVARSCQSRRRPCEGVDDPYNPYLKGAVWYEILTLSGLRVSSGLSALTASFRTNRCRTFPSRLMIFCDCPAKDCIIDAITARAAQGVCTLGFELRAPSSCTTIQALSASHLYHKEHSEISLITTTSNSTSPNSRCR